MQWRPLTWDRWASDLNARSNIVFWRMWRQVREILNDRSSHSFAALAGWTYAPSREEMVQWDVMAADGKLKDKTYRPWTDKRNNLFREGPRQVVRDETWKRNRRHFKEIWGEELTEEEQ